MEILLGIAVIVFLAAIILGLVILANQAMERKGVKIAEHTASCPDKTDCLHPHHNKQLLEHEHTKSCYLPEGHCYHPHHHYDSD